MRLGSFLHVVFGYVYSTSKYNDFGRVILKTPFPELNSMLIESCLSEDNDTADINNAHNIRRLYVSHTKKKTFLELLKLHNSKQSIFIIKKNRNGHYKFEMSSIGVLSPHKTDKGPKNVFFTIDNFKKLVEKFRITVGDA